VIHECNATHSWTTEDGITDLLVEPKLSWKRVTSDRLYQSRRRHSNDNQWLMMPVLLRDTDLRTCRPSGKSACASVSRLDYSNNEQHERSPAFLNLVSFYHHHYYYCLASIFYNLPLGRVHGTRQSARVSYPHIHWTARGKVNLQRI
jgi:hypothetical protein